jgi:hypothetical protein
VCFEERGAVVKVVGVEIGFPVPNILKMLYLIYEWANMSDSLM